MHAGRFQVLAQMGYIAGQQPTAMRRSCSFIACLPGYENGSTRGRWANVALTRLDIRKYGTQTSIARPE